MYNVFNKKKQNMYNLFVISNFTCLKASVTDGGRSTKQDHHARHCRAVDCA